MNATDLPSSFLGTPAGDYPPLVVVGMHRSGTSWTTSLLASSGVAIGEELYPADRGNPRGYFEDMRFLSLNRKMLTAACPKGAGGDPDLGWTEVGLVDQKALIPFREEAKSLVLHCRSHGAPWGWKDPRTTLLLDFWDSLVPDARYVMVYRYPWDVADSVQRLGWSLFVERPDYADKMWQAYNSAMLDFYKRHRERCILINTPRLTADPEQLQRLLHDRWGLNPTVRGEFSGRFETDLFSDRGLDDPIAALHCLAWPESARILGELESLADLPSMSSIDSSIESFVPRLAFNEAQSPRFSVITPVCDDGVYLPESVASAERACPVDTELILIDDGSTDPFTLRVLDGLRHLGYRVLRQDNQGLPCARNRAITQARGQYILPLDADNRIRTGLLQQAGEILDANPGVGVVFPDVEKFCMEQKTLQLPDFDHPTMYKHNYIDACAVFRKSVWAQVGGYDESLPALEDWDFWLSVSEAGWTFDHLREPLLEYRVRPGSMMSWVNRDEHLQVLQDRLRARHVPDLTQQRTEVGSGLLRSAGPGSLRRRLGAALSRWAEPLRFARVPAPDFLILGAMKAGTTSLHSCLVSHSRVCAPRVKEIHYFDLHYDQGSRWYREQLRLQRTPWVKLLSGESSPYYLFHPAVPARVAQHNPKARLVVLLRDPVTRAISHYHHAQRLGFEHLDLTQALAQEEARLEGQVQALASGRLRSSPAHQHLSYKTRGQYAEQLERWLKHFPSKQILIVQSEQLFAAPQQALDRICGFLGLSGRPLRGLRDLNSGEYPEVPQAVAIALKRHFDPWNDRLEQLLRAHWGDTIDRSLWR